MSRASSLRLFVLACTVVCGVSVARAATVTIVNMDGPNEGFNDPSPRLPVGGNTGTTLGQQRLIVFEAAANIWGANLNSPVEIRVDANFDVLPCNATSAVLGQAGPNDVFRDFAGAPLANTWYPQALANSLAGTDLSPATDDIGAEFNSAFGTTCAFPGGWYYGLDGLASFNDSDLLTVILHEIGHGLGFLSLVDDASGQRLLGFNDAFMLNLEDHSTGKTYPQMTDGERKTAATNTGNLHWVGPSVIAASTAYTAGVGPGPHVQMYAPHPLQSGSSVSHWSDALSPDELMEPSYTGSIHAPGLTANAFLDIGWGALDCGNGVLDTGEECDDTNHIDGDGCSAVCTVETCWDCSGEPSVCSPQTGTACNDGNPCTHDDTCSAGVCAGTAAPLMGCRQPFVHNKALVVLTNSATTDKRDALTWRWLKGTSTSALEFGDPVLGGTSYDLCVYDSTGAGTQIRMKHHLPAGLHWRATRTGFRYADRKATNNGISGMTLHVGGDGVATIRVSGRGRNLNMTALPLQQSPKVTVQLSNGSVCWEAEYSTHTRNDTVKFKATAD